MSLLRLIFGSMFQKRKRGRSNKIVLRIDSVEFDYRSVTNKMLHDATEIQIVSGDLDDRNKGRLLRQCKNPDGSLKITNWKLYEFCDDVFF